MEGAAVATGAGILRDKVLPPERRENHGSIVHNTPHLLLAASDPARMPSASFIVLEEAMLMTVDISNFAEMTGRRILIVEDEYYIASDLAEHLKALGVEIVGPAPTSTSALRLLQESRPLDGAVLDIVLSGRKDYRVAEALQYRHVPFVFLTGYDRELLPSLYSDAPLCTKPCEPQAVVRALLGQWKR